MGLNQQLADFKAEFLPAPQARRTARYDAQIEEIRAS
jgi:hypothetical protein